jgi:hypothetical protein
MSRQRTFEIGGVVAAVVLIAFGIASIAIGIGGRSTVNNSLAEQKVVGTPDMTPAGIKAEATKAGLNVSKLSIPSCSVANEAITSGTDARCFAQYMTIHALEATGGKYYSQMPRYASANGEGTNVEADAVKGKNGQPVDNPAREVWIQETALSTGLNTSYMASQISLFGIVVGIALLLSGLGFGVLSLGGALRSRDSAVASAGGLRHSTSVSPTGA